MQGGLLGNQYPWRQGAVGKGGSSQGLQVRLQTSPRSNRCEFLFLCCYVFLFVAVVYLFVFVVYLFDCMGFCVCCYVFLWLLRFFYMLIAII